MSGAVVLLMVACSLGWGALALRLAGVMDGLAWRERVVWAFGLGMGMIGWLGFWIALAGVLLSTAAALFPAFAALRVDPATALHSE